MPANTGFPARTVVWRRIGDDLAFDWACLIGGPEGFELSGTILAACNGHPFRAGYRIQCDAEWRTQRVEINTVLGDKATRLEMTTDGLSTWQVNGRAAPELAGCLDIDLEYTPATNALPINRLALAVGTEAEVAAAWVRFPQLSVERSAQTYVRLADDTFVYRSGSFEAVLQVDAASLPIRYEGQWLRVGESTAPTARS